MFFWKAKDTMDGSAAEALAAAYLTQQGLKMLARNFRVRGGEIDLICRDENTLVFVEVRLRRNNAYGGAAESITATKRRRIVHAATHYLARTPDTSRYACRFDCVLLSELNAGNVKWIRDAFSADD